MLKLSNCGNLKQKFLLLKNLGSKEVKREMFRKVYPLFMRTVTSLHVGSGNDLGLVDLPVQRERHTGFPKIEGSSLKGGVRESFELKAEQMKEEEKKGAEMKKKIEAVFGPEDAGGEGFMGAAGFTDARILFFPVRSARGVFAYLTSPYVLKRMADDFSVLEPAMREGVVFPGWESLQIGSGEILLGSATESALVIRSGNQNQVVLEEYPFRARGEERISSWADKIAPLLGLEPAWFKKRVAVVSDDDFADFVKNSTEVVTRIRIDSATGTVKEGALFNEEYVPSETVFYSLLLVGTNHFRKEEQKLFGSEDEVFEFLKTNLSAVLQIGGNATIGKGITRVHLASSVA